MQVKKYPVLYPGYPGYPVFLELWVIGFFYPFILSSGYCIGMEKQILELEPYWRKLMDAKTEQEKLSILAHHPAVQKFLNDPSALHPLLAQENPEYDLAIRAIVAVGQGSVVFHGRDEVAFKKLLEVLREVDAFYGSMGGILGYHLTLLKLIAGESVEEDGTIHYRKPREVKINEDTSAVKKLVRAGLERMDEMAEIYPVGGAGDRLNLHDESTGEPLPAACLHFCGRTLLEGLVRDLQAREYLRFKLGLGQVTTPIAMMTSHEKNNHQHILRICDQQGWFGRPRSAFLFFLQPLAPVITKEGNWSLSAPLTLSMKPGGHGVIWKLAIDQGVFSTFKSWKRRKALIRQINNPMAGIDHGLLAFTGYGLMHDKKFGFAACPRLPNTAEGMDVLREKVVQNGFEYSIANIEYVQFAKKGIAEGYADYPANTNILFADLTAVEQAVKITPFPGKNINMKQLAPYLAPDGTERQVEAGRLESTMQNITDHLTDFFDHRLRDDEQSSLSTYLTFNERIKTISVTKRSYVEGGSLVETPEGCFQDLQSNYCTLLTHGCGMDVDVSCVVELHPALGPLFSIIAQKIRGGKMSKRSELRLEIAELFMENVNIEGNLHIQADAVMGKKNAQGILEYSEQSGKCTLRHVKVHGHCVINLHGNGEFYAERGILTGLIEVQDGERVIAHEENGKTIYKKDKIPGPTWFWKYAFDEKDRIILKT